MLPIIKKDKTASWSSPWNSVLIQEAPSIERRSNIIQFLSFFFFLPTPYPQSSSFSLFLGIKISSQLVERVSKDLYSTVSLVISCVLCLLTCFVSDTADLVPLHLSFLIPCANPKDVIWYSTGDRRGNPKSVASQASFTSPIRSVTRWIKHHDNSQMARRPVPALLF